MSRFGLGWGISTALLACVFGLGLVLAGCGGTVSAPTEEGAAPATGSGTQESGPAEPAAKKYTIGVMPKLIGIEYFNQTKKGAEQAAEELGIELVYNGPASNDINKQSQMVETWITKRYDAICVAPNDPDAIAPVLEKARARGIKVLTWDADADEGVRDYFVNQCTYDAIAQTLVDVMAEGAGQDANYVIVTGSLTAANQNIWMEKMEAYRQETYPGMTNLSETPKASEEDQALATDVTMDTLKAYPEVNGIYAITSVALPGAAEGLRKAGAADSVFLTGLATPNSMKEYVMDDTVKKFIMWNVPDLGYLTVYAAVAALQGEIEEGVDTFDAGHIEGVEVRGTEIIMGKPLVFDKDNIDQYDF